MILRNYKSDRKEKAETKCCEFFNWKNGVFIGCAADKIDDEKA